MKFKILPFLGCRNDIAGSWCHNKAEKLNVYLHFTFQTLFRVLLWHRGEKIDVITFLAVINFGLDLLAKRGGLFNIDVFYVICIRESKCIRSEKML